MVRAAAASAGCLRSSLVVGAVESLVVVLLVMIMITIVPSAVAALVSSPVVPGAQRLVQAVMAAVVVEFSLVSSRRAAPLMVPRRAHSLISPHVPRRRHSLAGATNAP